MFYVITYENGVVKTGYFDRYEDAEQWAENYYWDKGFNFTIEEYLSEEDYLRSC